MSKTKHQRIQNHQPKQTKKQNNAHKIEPTKIIDSITATIKLISAIIEMLSKLA